MRIADQFSNVLQLAAALSLAGWVARPPDGSQNNLAEFNNQYDQYNFHQNGRFHPYAPNNQFANQHHNHGPLVDQVVAPNPNFMSNGHNGLYQSKDAEETFRAYMELQELISWQESYRRGDLPLTQHSNSAQYVMPVSGSSNYSPIGNDDGYGSGSSVGSPASSGISAVSSEVDNLSVASSPSPGSVFDGLDNSLSTPFQQINNPVEGTFDIDEILNDNDNAMSPEMPYNDENQKVPFASLLSSLDYDLNSPSALKNPDLDSFLTKPSPEYKPPHHTASITKGGDDPFNIQFTNSSFPNGFNQDTLVDIGSFDPSIFDNHLDNQDDFYDRALVQSLAKKGNPATCKCSDMFLIHLYFFQDRVSVAWI